ncbi:MAG: hypothetical protein ACT4NY_19400, partial [Pseudonocardiales bacterium]
GPVAWPTPGPARGLFAPAVSAPAGPPPPPRPPRAVHWCPDIKPRWTERQELLDDLAVFTRLTLAQGTTVFLLGGCLTLGVLGSARCLLEAARGARSVRYVTEQVGHADFVLVTEARRIGGITDVADLTMVNPLLLLARRNNEPFTAVVDNSGRYLNDRTGRGTRRIDHAR